MENKKDITKKDLLDAALLAHAWGFSVIPIGRDKKRSGDAIQMALLRRLGEAVVEPVPIRDLETLLAEGAP